LGAMLNDTWQQQQQDCKDWLYQQHCGANVLARQSAASMHVLRTPAPSTHTCYECRAMTLLIDFLVQLEAHQVTQVRGVLANHC
jgi:hypothetical protein